MFTENTIAYGWPRATGKDREMTWSECQICAFSAQADDGAELDDWEQEHAEEEHDGDATFLREGPEDD